MGSAASPISKTEDRVTRWCLFLGMILWFVDLNTVYALPSLSCEWGWFSFTVAGLSGLAVVEAIITLIAMVPMAVMVYLPWRNWRKSQTEKPTDNPRILNDTEKDRRSLLAFLAMMMNGFLFLFILATFVPMLALNVCARG